MLRNWVFAFLLTTLLAQGAIATATECGDIFSAGAAISVGSSLKISGPDGISRSGFFLGKMTDSSNVPTRVVFYDPAQRVVHYFPVDQWDARFGEGSEVISSQLAPVIQTVEQKGNTCSAYSVYNAFMQMERSEPDHPSMKKLASPGAQQKLLDELLRLKAIPGEGFTENLLRAIKRKYKIDVAELDGETDDAFERNLLSSLQNFRVVLIAFDVLPDMVVSSYASVDHSGGIGSERGKPSYIWLPLSATAKANGAVKWGRHTVLVLGSFQDSDRTYLLISDPNWKEFQIWDLAQLENRASSSMRAWAMHPKAFY